jgi:hypothetical protein
VPHRTSFNKCQVVPPKGSVPEQTLTRRSVVDIKRA